MSVNLSDTTPAAPAGSINGAWQKDASSNVSVSVPDTTDAANITTGLLALAHGGTDADLSATGGTHQVLKQSSTGGAITVGQLAESDLSFTNITTNDVSTSKHGFVPILPNDATKFLNGVGGYTVPTGTVVNHADDETPSGTVNGSNVTFTLAHAPSPSGSLQLWRQGVGQIAGTDFTLSSATITFTTAPVTGDLLNAWYRY